jgi:hypothetical protein
VSELYYIILKKNTCLRELAGLSTFPCFIWLKTDEIAKYIDKCTMVLCSNDVVSPQRDLSIFMSRIIGYMPLQLLRFRDTPLLFATSEAYHYNFTDVQHIPLLIPSTLKEHLGL